jgi:hypothetical protein
MEIPAFPFSISDFATIAAEIHAGETGFAEWKTIHRGNIRIRLVTYSACYLADHWCNKGHIIFCVEGSMETELQNGQKHLLEKGMLYTVGDNSASHRSYSKSGCILFIVD